MRINKYILENKKLAGDMDYYQMMIAEMELLQDHLRHTEYRYSPALKRKLTRKLNEARKHFFLLNKFYGEDLRRGDAANALLLEIMEGIYDLSTAVKCLK